MPTPQGMTPIHHLKLTMTKTSLPECGYFWFWVYVPVKEKKYVKQFQKIKKKLKKNPLEVDEIKRKRNKRIYLNIQNHSLKE